MATANLLATPQYRNNEGADPGEMPSSLATPDKIPTEVDTPMNNALPQPSPTTDARPRKQRNWRLPNDDQLGVYNPRRSERLRRKHVPAGQDALG